MFKSLHETVNMENYFSVGAWNTRMEENIRELIFLRSSIILNTFHLTASGPVIYQWWFIPATTLLLIRSYQIVFRTSQEVLKLLFFQRRKISQPFLKCCFVEFYLLLKNMYKSLFHICNSTCYFISSAFYRCF